MSTRTVASSSPANGRLRVGADSHEGRPFLASSDPSINAARGRVEASKNYRARPCLSIRTFTEERTAQREQQTGKSGVTAKDLERTWGRRRCLVRIERFWIA